MLRNAPRGRINTRDGKRATKLLLPERNFDATVRVALTILPLLKFHRELVRLRCDRNPD